VSINARTEDDVDEKLVISKVAKASGANYSYHKEQKRPMPAAEPVVRVIVNLYSKLVPLIIIIIVVVIQCICSVPITC